MFVFRSLFWAIAKRWSPYHGLMLNSKNSQSGSSTTLKEIQILAAEQIFGGRLPCQKIFTEIKIQLEIEEISWSNRQLTFPKFFGDILTKEK